MVQLLMVTSAELDSDPTNNQVSLGAFVTEKQADLDVEVYLDADRDGVIDPGEPRTGVEVTLLNHGTVGEPAGLSRLVRASYLEGVRYYDVFEPDEQIGASHPAEAGYLEKNRRVRALVCPA